MTTLPKREREKLILELLPVAYEAARYYNKRTPSSAVFELKDLEQAAVCGLIQAIDRFDPSRNDNIKLYVKYRVYGAVRDFLINCDFMPRTFRSKQRKLFKLAREFGYDETDYPKLAVLAGIPEDECQLLLNQNNLFVDAHVASSIGSASSCTTPSTHFDSHQYDDAFEQLVSNAVGQVDRDEPYESTFLSELKEIVHEALYRMAKAGYGKERYVLTEFYLKRVPQCKLAKRLGLTRGGVSSVVARARKLLRRFIPGELVQELIREQK